MNKIKPEKEIEVFEVWLDDNKIKELEGKINELGGSKEHVHFDDLKGNHIILIHKDTEIMEVVK